MPDANSIIRKEIEELSGHRHDMAQRVALFDGKPFNLAALSWIYAEWLPYRTHLIRRNGVDNIFSWFVGWPVTPPIG
eukprot:scaffold1511_cov170-Amphora_coffeaeformis.AAC.17